MNLTLSTTAPMPTGAGLAALALQFEATLGQQRRLRWPRALVYSAAALLATALLWANLAPVDRVVHTQGRIIPTGRAQVVQHLEGGIVAKVFVREGQAVRAGESLLAVSDLQANSTLGEKRARLAGLAARVSRLRAESQGSTSLGLPDAAATASAEARQQQEAFNARVSKLNQSLRVVEEQIAQKRQEAEEQAERGRGLAKELGVARQQLDVVTALLAKNAASQMEFLDAQARVERLATQQRETETAFPRLLAAVQELRARADEMRAQFRSDARTGLADAEVDRRRLQQEIDADDDRVRRTLVVAPVDGVVNKLMFNTVGGVVRPGEVLLEITPDDGTVTVESRVSPAERGALRVGQRAVVKVAAYDYTVYGSLNGQVTEISADSLADERGERYFRVAMTVDQASLRALGQPVTPGMTVVADAVAGQRTVMQYLLSPLKGLWASALRDSR